MNRIILEAQRQAYRKKMRRDQLDRTFGRARAIASFDEWDREFLLRRPADRMNDLFIRLQSKEMWYFTICYLVGSINR